MAHILPESPPLAVPHGVLKAFRALKSLPDSYYIWHHLAPWQVNTPDFLIYYDGRVSLVKISSTAAGHAIPAAQLRLLGDDLPPLGQEEAQTLAAFLTSVDLSPADRPETLIVFSNIPHKQVLESRLTRLDGDPIWVGREILQEDSSIHWDDFLPQTQLNSLEFEKLRHAFTPEIVVPSDFTVRLPQPRRVEAGLTSYILDYQQETAVKADLFLENDSEALSGNFRLNILNGVAGSGKTLILLYRLRLLFHLYPEKKFLVLTHNRPLCHDLQSRFYRLENLLPDRIEWRTFNGWCYTHWPKTKNWIEPLQLKQRGRLIHQVWAEKLHNTSITERMLLSEIDWLKDQLPDLMDQYLTVDRRGRGFRLSDAQRRQMLQAVTRYQEVLEQTQKRDWGDIPRILWQEAINHQVDLPEYDVILVDEAQFFAPLWVNLIQQSLKSPNGHLFMVADPTQGFLGRKTTWKSVGLEARGHSHQLKKSFRTTLEILQFATLFYRLRLPDEIDEDIIAPDLLNMPNGSFPVIITLKSTQDEIARVVNEVVTIVKNGCPRRDVLILHANGKGVQALIQALDHHLGKNAALDPKETYPGDYIRITTLNASAGLESPIVFLTGLRELFEEEQSLRLSDEEREDLIRDNTRKIYMAATRAGQRLIFTYVGETPISLKQALAHQ